MQRQKIKRHRVIKSCRYCYVHKLKCDKALPCRTCSSMNNTSECIYGFNKNDNNSKEINGNTVSNEKPFRPLTTRKIDKTPKGTLVYRSKYFYPFFANSINDRVLSSHTYGHLLPSQKFKRNEITKFNRFTNPLNSIEDTLALLPPSEETALSQVEAYFDSVHPIIPVLSKSKIVEALQTLKNPNDRRESINVPNLLIIIALFFCSSYAAVASGVIPDLLLCNKYYAGYRLLLEISEFPLRPQLESLKAFTIVNFVIDPNMVDATAYSSLLVRMGQQLGLHKMEDIQSKLLWGYLLYIEGSASVVSGFPHFTPEYLVAETVIPTPESKDQNGISAAYTIGRWKVNTIFRNVMDLSGRQVISESDFLSNKRQIEKLYDEILEITNVLRMEFPFCSTYFSSTLLVFLYRLHLRHIALSYGQSRKDKLLQKTDNQVHSAQSIDITSSLTARHNYGDDVIHLSLLLLLHTYERLVQENTANLAWYTRGSTAMQYLFVIIKDLYQNELKPCGFNTFSESLKKTMSADIEEILKKDGVFFKFVLIDHVIGLLELKLAALWNDEDLYKFILIKAIKEKVWQVFKNQLEQNENRLGEISKCRLFVRGEKHLQNFKSINFEDYIDNWESDVVLLEMNKILMNWIDDLQG
ncbi:hypothetical protein ZYGR_0AY02000 [Zygosaccharomyces rouxii]|uniref:Zn(2)-C6 fungal-type domain-containing protein n=1 Tax=Zygosaccharomyces rouxii TaxID=4956 RepID=A0A1Q3AJA3_ZYGRO|nr:hypothetical protein ZYGR_0AY02000 [Zygosaccharomyces rouxii]